MTTPAQLLAELYEIDPSLREHEAELIPLIATLLEHDPAQKPSPAFVKKLRQELQARMNAMTSGAVEHHMTYGAPSAFSAYFGRFAYALAGATAAVIIAVPVTLQFTQDGFAPPSAPMDKDAMEREADDGYAVTDQATGTMTTSPSPTGNNPVPGAYSRTQAGGGGGGDMGMDSKMGAAGMLVAPWNPVKYVLAGDLPALPTGNVDVLERRPSATNVSANSVLKAFDIDSIDLSSFDGGTLDMVSFSQHKPFGYTINLSVRDGSVSINQQWDQWPHPETNCQDDVCYRNLQPKIGDIPADGELIRIANAFVAEHDISLDGYGDPIVDTAWRVQYDMTQDKRMAWIPESIRVVYPLMIDGNTVVESGGEPTGLSVQVSIKHKRVSDAWGITAYAFDRTAHDGVSDQADIEKFLALSGTQNPTATEVTLSNPMKTFVHLYTYENNTSHDLFVPALIFQVTNVPAGIDYAPRTVVVPLAKDLLDEAIQNQPIPIDPMPMPLIMEEAAR